MITVIIITLINIIINNNHLDRHHNYIHIVINISTSLHLYEYNVVIRKKLFSITILILINTILTIVKAICINIIIYLNIIIFILVIMISYYFEDCMFLLEN